MNIDVDCPSRYFFADGSSIGCERGSHDDPGDPKPDEHLCRVTHRWTGERGGEVTAINGRAKETDAPPGVLAAALAAACEVAWLTDAQLNRLILACHELADVAAAERRGREPS